VTNPPVNPDISAITTTTIDTSLIEPDNEEFIESVHEYEEINYNGEFTVNLLNRWEYTDIFGMFTATRGESEIDGAMMLILTVPSSDIDGMGFEEYLEMSGILGSGGNNDGGVEILNIEDTEVDGLEAVRIEMLTDVMGNNFDVTMYAVTDYSGIYMIMYYKMGVVDYMDEFEIMVDSFRAYGIKRYTAGIGE